MNTSQLVHHFYGGTDLALEQTVKLVQKGLQRAEYGELYVESYETTGLVKENGFYKTRLPQREYGFGFRVGHQEKIGFAYSDQFNKASLAAAIKAAREALNGHHGTQRVGFGCHLPSFYSQEDPIGSIHITDKIKKIDEIEAYILSLDPNIIHASISYGASAKNVHIITADGTALFDCRPNAHLGLSLALQDNNGNMEMGSASLGGVVLSDDILHGDLWKEKVEEALQQARLLLKAKPAPAGEMDVVLGNGWPAVLLHEAIGHGLEGDFNRRGISAFSGKVGQRVAAPHVTIVDQGNLPDERGSLHFDDEGTPTKRNVLVENGILTGYMQDRQNAFLMGVPLTGNGRRQGYRKPPIPRMTNTFFEAGDLSPEEIISSVRNGIYIKELGGGEVDITSGKFNMRATLAYRIQNGKICEPLKGASLIGEGRDVIQGITMMGNDLALEKTYGSCGKDGQTVSVGCGQPTLLVPNMTVGGMG
ncbi:MAG: hypothetical protein AUJ12_01170 [Alphaproteobacteria bacterium CG1_02_46_17]|nr:MAG: hypothetical protein AUJ12_01170 [Alphaproteobacteria bacterium CG1_02_46_17]